MNATTVTLACPNCRTTLDLVVNGTMLDVSRPLACRVCSQSFSLHFFCPDAKSASRHIFTATQLRVDNFGAIYTFCPEHTFTTYALVGDVKSQRQQNFLYPLTHFLDSLAFRIALTLEGWRLRFVTRR